MDDALKLETAKLVRSWSQYDAAFLRDYLVADVEDPRINVQSILSRHFLLAELFGARFEELMLHELRFASAMNWLGQLAKSAGDAEERRGILHALARGADNAEGIEVPPFMLRTFNLLPAAVGGATVPNYIHGFLAGQGSETDASCCDTFLDLWRKELAAESPQGVSGPRTRVRFRKRLPFSCNVWSRPLD